MILRKSLKGRFSFIFSIKDNSSASLDEFLRDYKIHNRIYRRL